MENDNLNEIDEKSIIKEENIISNDEYNTFKKNDNTIYENNLNNNEIDDNNDENIQNKSNLNNKNNNNIVPKELNFKSKFILAVKNDKISIILFFLVYILTYNFIKVTTYSKDMDITSYLVIHKFLIYFSSFMSILCHIRCTFTDPGKITHELNPYYIEFYCQIREQGLLQAMKFNEKIDRKAFFKMLKSGYDSDEFSEYDSTEYEAVTSIQNEDINKLTKSNLISLKRCFKCYIVRIPGVKHCQKCQGCILKRDHHCPWMFNCIGQFNQKFFIQYIWYTFIGLFEIAIIILYYIYYKDYA